MQLHLNNLPEHTARTTELDQDFRRVPECWTMEMHTSNYHSHFSHVTLQPINHKNRIHIEMQETL